MIIVGDCREVMAGMEPDSIDAIVCDPPYGLEFMGKEWDKLDTGKNATRWDGRRTATGAPVRDPDDPGGRHAATVSPSRPNPQCATCGHYKYSGTPCRCESPKWLPRSNPQAKGMQDWHESWAREAFRVLKPGGHLLAFGGTRTFHRLTVAIEDAGFEIRDCLSWLYGSGFPKSLDVSKAIDKMAGAEREVVGTKLGQPGYSLAPDKGRGVPCVAHGDSAKECAITAPATPEAAQWAGWGTALKPAWEPVIVARKPLIGTVAANVLQHGTGALNIDACRIGYQIDDLAQRTARTGSQAGRVYGASNQVAITGGELAPPNALGRWPANVVLDEAAAAMLDAQSGELRARGNKTPTKRQRSAGSWAANGSAFGIGPDGPIDPGSAGGASRFFYCAKSSRRERNAGLEGMPADRPVFGDDGGTYKGLSNSCLPQANVHPTVKPIALMRWLVRLVTPPGGVVLDPFAGSGSTGCAAALEGFAFIGIEMDPTYAEIAERRIAYWSAQRPTVLQAALPLEGVAD